MNELKKAQIGIRFTESEKTIIKKLAKKRNQTFTGFVREAIFSHINNLKNTYELDIEFFLSKYDKINTFIENIKQLVKDMKDRFDLCQLEEIKQKLSIEL